MESVAAFVWNGWQLCRGISGRIHLESVAALPWNTHIEKREGLFQRGGKEFLQCLPQLAEPLEPTPQLGQFGQSGLGPTAPIE